MGLEAISRGASELLAVEKANGAYQCLKGNCSVAQSRLHDDEVIVHKKGDFFKKWTWGYSTGIV